MALADNNVYGLPVCFQCLRCCERRGRDEENCRLMDTGACVGKGERGVG